MAGPIQPAKITLPPDIEATLAQQEKSLVLIKGIRDNTKALGEPTTELDAQIDLAERIIKSAKDIVERVKKL